MQGAFSVEGVPPEFQTTTSYAPITIRPPRRRRAGGRRATVNPTMAILFSSRCRARDYEVVVEDGQELRRN